jgi:hypothetical protein
LTASHHHQTAAAPDSPLGVTLRHQGLVGPTQIASITRMLAQASHITIATAGMTEKDVFMYWQDNNLE